MRTLPRPARFYLYSVWVLGLFSVLLTPLYTSVQPFNFILIAVSLGALLISDRYFVVFGTKSGNQIAMTVTDALTIFLIGTTGAYGSIVVVLGSIIVDIIVKRAWFKAIFNASQRMIIYIAMLAIYVAVSEQGAPPFYGFRGLLAFLLLAVTHHVLNIVLVSTVLAFASGQRLLRVYAENFRQIHWVHYITLPFGAILAYFWATNPWMLVPVAIPLIMARHSFQTMAELQEQNQRNEELAREATHLLNELKLKQEELLRSSKLAALGTFAAGIGHEFNNLLTAVLGNAQLGLMCEEPAEKDEVLDRIVRASDRGRSITGDLLTFARRRDPKREPTDLVALVIETIALVRHDFAQTNVHLEQRLAPISTVFCDPGQISQVLMNLLTNARDAMPEGQPGAIVVSLQENCGVVELAVTDNGSGIPADVLPNIFQPFITTKSGSRNGRRPGTGLGLAITHGIVESHSGSINVYSTVGIGTTMTVRLPVGDVPQSTAELLEDDEAEMAIRAVG